MAFRPYKARVFRRRASSAASANSQSRNVVIFGTLEVAFGQTVQYVLDIFKETSIGLTRRPLMRSQAASASRSMACFSAVLARTRLRVCRSPSRL